MSVVTLSCFSLLSLLLVEGRGATECRCGATKASEDLVVVVHVVGNVHNKE